MALAQSASAPDLRRPGSGGSLKKAGAALSGSSSQVFTTTLYEQMLGKKLFKNHFPSIPPAGKSITVPLNDSAQQDLQSEIHFPLPPTPVHERKFRRISHGPGEIYVHHGLKDQLLPAEESRKAFNDFRYGIRGQKGCSTEDTMKAGLLLGVAAYQNEVAENVYESHKKEPLGRAFTRGHSLKMLPEGYGNSSGIPQDAKEVIYALHQKPDPEDVRLMYKYTHNNFNPGERIERSYRWPSETREKNFRFGHGEGVPQALNWDVEDDGTVKRTRLVQKNVEDYRNVQHTKVYQKAHAKQGKHGPPLDPNFQHGVKSGVSDYTAKSCIQGYYSLEEQLPDQDLGRCLKPGRRNVTVATRAFGVPSVRTDIPAPHPEKRSIADNCSYGDECSAAALLNPQRFDDRGVPDREFLVRRPKEELRALVDNCDVDGVDFDSLWEECVGLFDDGLPLVSLDAMLFVQTRRIEDRVASLHTGPGPGLAAYKGAL
ncbi:unnamed protein product [Effrenium voratum]|nr:unnamed protein product [Effrenium voratum]